MSINIRHLFLRFFVVWAEVVRIGKTYRLEPTCILAVLNDESVFATFSVKLLFTFGFFFLYAALKICHFHKWFGKQKCQSLHQVKYYSIQ